MLRQRVITAVIVAPLALLIIFWAPPAIFRTALSALWLLSSIEYARLANLGRIGTVALVIVQATVFLLLFNGWQGVTELSLSILTAACLTWCLMFLRLVTFRPGQPPQFGYSILGFACAVASMTFAWLALAMMRDFDHGEFWIVGFLLIIWGADIGAYFSGRRFGGARLASRISPSKTWSGFWGGLVAAVVLAVAYVSVLPMLDAPLAIVGGLAALTMLASVGGDLFISIQKRTLGLKDTGNLLPGHGGLLDRFDSMIAAAPFFALGLLLAGV